MIWVVPEDSDIADIRCGRHTDRLGMRQVARKILAPPSFSGYLVGGLGFLPHLFAFYLPYTRRFYC
jgi:hypothetical protein